MLGVALGGHKVELSYAETGAEGIDLLSSAQVEEVQLVGDLGEIGQIDPVVPDEALQLAPGEAVAEDGGIDHAVGREDHAALLRHPHRLLQCLAAVAFLKQVVHGPQDQGQVEGVVSEGGEVDGVALADGHSFAGLSQLVEDFNVVLHQLHRIHPVSHPGKGVGVASRGSANLQNPCAGGQVFLDKVHGGDEFHMPRPGQQAAVFVVVLVKLVQIGFHGTSLLKIKNRQCQLKSYTAVKYLIMRSYASGYDNVSPARRESPLTDLGIFQEYTKANMSRTSLKDFLHCSTKSCGCQGDFLEKGCVFCRMR